MDAIQERHQRERRQKLAPAPGAQWMSLESPPPPAPAHLNAEWSGLHGSNPLWRRNVDVWRSPSHVSLRGASLPAIRPKTSPATASASSTQPIPASVVPPAPKLPGQPASPPELAGPSSSTSTSRAVTPFSAPAPSRPLDAYPPPPWAPPSTPANLSSASSCLDQETVLRLPPQQPPSSSSARAESMAAPPSLTIQQQPQTRRQQAVLQSVPSGLELDGPTAANLPVPGGPLYLRARVQQPKEQEVAEGATSTAQETASLSAAPRHGASRLPPLERPSADTTGLSHSVSCIQLPPSYSVSFSQRCSDASRVTALHRVSYVHRASSHCSSIPYIPARPVLTPALPLPEPPSAAARRPLCDRIQNATWAVARALGFQAFNDSAAPASASSAPRFVPSTAFLAADHLEALIVRNLMPRLAGPDGAAAAAGSAASADKAAESPAAASEEQQEQKQQEVLFARAVWELHSHIFLSYEGTAGWCRLVGLSARPSACESELLVQHSAGEPRVLHLLMCELALYFLLYSEAANLRHTPELMWFMFWAANHSPEMEALWREGLRAEQQLDNARQRRLGMRNTLQAQISSAQQQLAHEPAACTPAHCSKAAADLHARLPSLLPLFALPPSSTASSADVSLPCPASRELFCDLAAHGDGGFWTDVLVTPLFTLLAFEVDHMASAGQEMAHRLGYDDVNESMCQRDRVRRLLAALGVVPEAAAAGQVHGALAALTRLGYPVEGDADAATAVTSADPRQFEPVLAASFWADRVFVKTHRERRSWLSLLRAFYRVYSLQLVLLHATMAWSFAPGSLTMLSSAVITHAVVAALERTANWWLSRATRDPLQAARERDNWVTGPLAKAAAAAASEGPHDAETGAAVPAEVGAMPRRRRLSDSGAVDVRMEQRRNVVVEGAPLWGVFGWIEWVMVAAAMLGLFALQYMGPPGLKPMAKSYWPLAAGGYVAAVVGHGLLTTRDGYAVSLSSVMRLPALFRASSQRAAAGCWLERPMAVGWRAAALTAVFWVQVLAAKVAFDYFVIMRPMAGQVRLILHRNWMGCTGHYSLFGSKLPLRCQDGDWLLVALRVAPFVLVCLVDTQIFYQLVLMAWGLVHGLVTLNLGIAGSWEGLRAEFHRAPLRWWARCMSPQANKAARAAAAAAQRRRREAAAGHGANSPRCGLEDEDSEYGSVYGADGAFCRPSSDGSLSSLGKGLTAPNEPCSSAATSSDDSTSSTCDSSSASAASAPKAPAKKGGRGRRDAASAAELVSMLAGQGDEQLAQWMAFAAAWDAVVEDLRACDLISDRERANLVFTRLPAAATCMAVGAAPAVPATPDAASGDAESASSSAAAPGSPSTHRSLRPILLPAFFYAGQVQRVVDTGAASPSQQLVLGELRAVLVWLGCQLGLLGGPQAAALLAAPCCTAALDAAHTRSREQGLAALRSLLAAMQGLMEPVCVVRQQTLYGEAAEALEGLLTALDVECRAVAKLRLGVGKKGGKKKAVAASEEQQLEEQDPQAAAVAAMEVLTALRTSLLQQPRWLSAALSALSPEGFSSPAPSSPPRSVDPCLLARVLSTASKMLSLSSAAAQPTGAEARRILGFFVTSLANRQLAQPCAVAAMPSWTVLTPLYGEDVLFPLEAHTVAEALGVPAGASPSSALPDLLTETEDRVSLMAYVRSMFPKDWDNFKERLGASLGGVDLRAATELDFAEGGPLAEHALALQLWASYRGQLLARTVRGMAAYERALRVLAVMEAPRAPGTSRLEHAAEVEDVVGAKFTHVVASQLYGSNRRSSNLRNRWLAESTDVLLEAFPHLRVSYLDVVPNISGAKGTEASPVNQFAVLIRGLRPTGLQPAVDRTEELYRVRLPYNRYSKRGVILGEGKPENQNQAVIFCFGEALQTIDMNQDNALAEALKMRNLLTELRPELDSRAARKAAEAVRATAGSSPELPNASEFKQLLSQLRSAERPVAVVGFREWVFSDKAGALGSFAASSEFAFSTMVQRNMSYPANVRLHYGHPDAFNKLFIMTRGGVSKATRQLHVSEDIFGGMNHSLRGARIKFREYIAVGKGRDMGFDSINAFESKISAGFGEVALSRDLQRMATRVDLWRCLHLYHSLAGNYINTWLVMGSVYAHVYALLFFALAQAAVYRTVIYYPSPPPPPPGTPIMPMPFPSASSPPGVIRESLAYDTIRVEHVLQLGLLSLLPYVAEMALEYGLVRGLLAALAQVLSGSFTFFIFKQQTTTTALHRSMLYGGATYVATGRGFSITSSSFIKLFANFGRSHIALGFELLAMALALAATNDCARCSYAGLTWGTWLAALSLILAPCWFNPMAFSLAKVKRDMHAWAAWLRGEADRELGCTWHQWNRRQLAHSRDDSGTQTDRRLNVAQSLLLRAVPPALLTLAAASRLTLRLSGLPAVLPPQLAFLRSSWALFFIASGVLWGTLAAALSVSRRAHQLSDRQRMRVWSFWVSAAGAACVALFLVGLSRWYSGNGLANLTLLLYANANLALALHRALEHVAPRSRAARRLVDGGYWLLDCVLGWLLLGLLGGLSLAGVVSRIQTSMLFNVTFARSVRRGRMVKTIGTAKAERRQQEALMGMVLDGGDAGSVAGGSDGASEVGSGDRRTPQRLQLRG